MVTPLVLPGERLCLVPYTPAHDEALFACTTPETFRYFLSWPARHELDAFRSWMHEGVRDPAHRIAFTMVRASGEELGRLTPAALAARIVGSSSYMDILPRHKGLEIGSTWIHPAWQGTGVNPASKALLLDHAFGALGCERVQLKSDARNAQSRAAMSKLGATFEGILRRHRVMADGYVRDTAMFSIIREEWPRVKAGLEERIRLVPRIDL
ncbi:MAG: GNAT family N-acetyltransferase [Phycisphaerales bacterium]|nr:GNAT family N-acetyltransferase [Phycisphaerales bacterium]